MEPVLVIDLGTSFIRAVVGRMEKETPKVLAIAMEPSKGFDKGLVVDIDEAAGVVSSVVKDVRSQCQLPLGRAYVVISGGHTSSILSTGHILVLDTVRIRETDKDAVIEDGRRKSGLRPDQEVIHLIPLEFQVDGGAIVTNPVGLSAGVLEAKITLAAALSTSLANVKETLHRAGLEVAGLALKPFATPWGIVSEDISQDCVVVDIGGGTTSVTLLSDGKVYHSSVIPLGGNHITRDIALGLKLDIDQAEQVKKDFGSALGDDVDDMDFVNLGEKQHGRLISKKYMCQIIEARLDEIFTLAKSELDDVISDSLAPASIVFTGGSSRIPGLEELAKRIFDLPTSQARITELEGTADKREFLSASAAGLLLHTVESLNVGEDIDTLPQTLTAEAYERLKEWIASRVTGRRV